MSRSQDKPDAVLRTAHREFRPLIQEILRLGGSARFTNGGHIQVRLGPAITHLPASASTTRNYTHNLRKMIRNHQAAA